MSADKVPHTVSKSNTCAENSNASRLNEIHACAAACSVVRRSLFFRSVSRSLSSAFLVDAIIPVSKYSAASEFTVLSYRRPPHNVSTILNTVLIFRGSSELTVCLTECVLLARRLFKTSKFWPVYRGQSTQ